MGLVDYSDSESDSEVPQSTVVPTAPAASTKKPFQKLVDKANPGKILVNLTSASVSTDDAPSNDEPAAKRLKTGGTSRFSGFSSFLPAPKAITKPTAAGESGGKAPPRVGINLKTSSEAAFSRHSLASGSRDDDNDDEGEISLPRASGSGGSGLKLPPPKTSAATPAAQPSIPEGQMPAEEVKLVGKPMMFRPLSVSRKPAKKNGTKASGTAPKPAAPASASPQPAVSPAPVPAVPPKKKMTSLFSVEDDTPSVQPAIEEDEGPYEPEFTEYDNSVYQQAQYDYASYAQPLAATSSNVDPNSLDAIAHDLNLDPIARRELFGRGGEPNKGTTAKSVINFNLDNEYRHNEELRASGALEQQQHNPLRAIRPGKHSLQQLVNQVQSQKDALEENFAKNRSAQHQAGSRYGWK